MVTMLGGGAMLSSAGVMVGGGGTSMGVETMKRQGVGGGVGGYPVAAAMPAAAAAPYDHYALPVQAGAGAGAVPLGADVLGMGFEGGPPFHEFHVGAAMAPSFHFGTAD